MAVAGIVYRGGEEERKRRRDIAWVLWWHSSRGKTWTIKGDACSNFFVYYSFGVFKPENLRQLGVLKAAKYGPLFYIACKGLIRVENIDCNWLRLWRPNSS